ncbi:MAG: hypothetical protein JXR11_03700 [Balneola sp.]
MNINILTSFIIAGILLLMLAYMNLGVSNNSTELVVSQSKQSQKIDIQSVISNDFPKMGFAFNSVIDSLIVEADSTKITFKSNLDNSVDGSIERITWELTTEDVTSTTNPNDKILRRTVDSDVTDILLGVTAFSLKYYDSYGSTTPLSTPLSSSDIDNIRQIEVAVEIQSSELISATYGGNSNYITTIWTKRFTPRNLTSNL